MLPKEVVVLRSFASRSTAHACQVPFHIDDINDMDIIDFFIFENRGEACRQGFFEEVGLVWGGFCHCFFSVSCQVPYRGHAHRGRHRLQATVLDQDSHLMVHVGLVRFVTFPSGTTLRTASANDERRLASGTEFHVCSLIFGCFCQVNGILDWKGVNLFVLQPRRLEHDKARRSKGRQC